MRIYLQIEMEKNEVINADVEQLNDSYIEYEAENIDELYKKLKEKKIEIKDEETEEKIGEILNEIEILETENEPLQYEIKHWVSNRSFGELIDMYNEGEILKPEMQRKFVWDTLKSSRLIESIIMGLPIPPLFLLEVGKNQYEIIDGFQRLTALVNYVDGKSWNPENGKKKIAARLSKKVTREISGKTFSELQSEYKRMIKRSTIPLIEFKQLTPGNLSSKYLIFERINTGSEKLNPMQIRRSLAYGSFIYDLYEKTENFIEFNKLFTTNQIKKDANVEAFLRVFVMYQIYNETYSIEREGIGNILNKFCEDHKNTSIDEDFIIKFNEALELIKEIFKDEKTRFKKIELEEDNMVFKGNLNIGILESFFAVAMNSSIKISHDQIFENYKEIISKLILDSQNKIIKNPFSVSTGSKDSIFGRFEIWKDILGVK